MAERNLSARRNAAMEKGSATLMSDGPFCSFGAGEMNRTPDLLITNELLYRLSYTGFVVQPAIIA